MLSWGPAGALGFGQARAEVLGVVCSAPGLDQEEADLGSFTGSASLILAVGVELLWAELPGWPKLLFPPADRAMGSEWSSDTWIQIPAPPLPC